MHRLLCLYVFRSHTESIPTREERVTLETFRNMLKRESQMASIDLMSPDRNLSGLTTSLAAGVAQANVQNVVATETIQTYYQSMAEGFNDWIDHVNKATIEIKSVFDSLAKKDDAV